MSFCFREFVSLIFNRGYKIFTRQYFSKYHNFSSGCRLFPPAPHNDLLWKDKVREALNIAKVYSDYYFSFLGQCLHQLIWHTYVSHYSTTRLCSFSSDGPTCCCCGWCCCGCSSCLLLFFSVWNAASTFCAGHKNLCRCFTFFCDKENMTGYCYQRVNQTDKFGSDSESSNHHWNNDVNNNIVQSIKP